MMFVGAGSAILRASTHRNATGSATLFHSAVHAIEHLAAVYCRCRILNTTSDQT